MFEIIWRAFSGECDHVRDGLLAGSIRRGSRSVRLMRFGGAPAS